jgi:hypothetical protein
LFSHCCLGCLTALAGFVGVSFGLDPGLLARLGIGQGLV